MCRIAWKKTRDCRKIVLLDQGLKCGALLREQNSIRLHLFVDMLFFLTPYIPF